MYYINKKLMHLKYVVPNLPPFKDLPQNNPYNLQGHPEGNLKSDSIFFSSSSSCSRLPTKFPCLPLVLFYLFPTLAVFFLISYYWHLKTWVHQIHIFHSCQNVYRPNWCIIKYPLGNIPVGWWSALDTVVPFLSFCVRPPTQPMCFPRLCGFYSEILEF